MTQVPESKLLDIVVAGFPCVTQTKRVNALNAPVTELLVSPDFPNLLQEMVYIHRMGTFLSACNVRTNSCVPCTVLVFSC